VNAAIASPGASHPVAANDPLFDNAAFWNVRYESDPGLGSGIGSRGEVAAYKRAVIGSFLDEMRPRTLLDVGCGDLEIVAPLNLPASYCGLDVSEVIIARNKVRFPRLRFEHADLCVLDDFERLSADVVLCLDVLIHQHTRTHYERMVGRLVSLARTGGLVSGFAASPRSPYRSAITAYHEPVTESLQRAGAKGIRIVGAYRDTVMVAFER
jgi:SAM-dependent methyltransferase